MLTRAPRLQKPLAKPATDVARDHVLISQHLCASSPNLNVYATHRFSLSHRAAHDVGQALQDRLEADPLTARAFVHLDWEASHDIEHGGRPSVATVISVQNAANP
mgnify:CR=1 FL=1